MHRNPSERSVGAWGAVGLFFVSYALSFLLFQGLSRLVPASSLDSYTTGVICWTVAMIVVGVSAVVAVPRLAGEIHFAVGAGSGLLAAVVGFAAANLTALVQSKIGRLDFPNHSVATIGLVLVVAPIIEELFGRGLVLNCLLQRLGTVTAVLLLSVLFASFHESFWPAFIGQIILSIVFLKSGRSVTVSAIAHCALNATGTFPSALILIRPGGEYLGEFSCRWR